ncbi:glycosyltransferase family 2 protein [Methylorubrum thiocyanatum]|uniref:glycosyltransferase family 2 protein n=1 Tax=Methylorubrum thiocyanatum TaxID=47958 RepID=UPI00398C80E6
MEHRAAVVSAVVPCLDEEAAIGSVVAGLLEQAIAEVVVVDGGSRDATVVRAAAAGARVVVEPSRGYGRALRAGIAATRPDADLILFVDGDGSDRLDRVPDLLGPLRRGEADFVHGSRLRGPREPGALSLPQIVAGHLAGLLIRLAYGVRFTDMSPFRAIRCDALDRLGMRDETYGWNLEMLMRAAAGGLRCVEVPVGQRPRQGGASKVSGNLRTGFRAAWSILRTFRVVARELRGPRRGSH